MGSPTHLRFIRRITCLRCLRYETQHLVGGERGAENLEPMESSPVSHSMRGGRLSNGENTEIADSLASFSREGGVWSPRTLGYYARKKGKRENWRTSDAVPSKRGRICSAGRNAGGESSVRYGLEDNCLIAHESCHEGDVEDVPSERRKSFLARKRAGKELTYLHSIKRQTHHQDEIGDSDEYCGLVNCVLGGMNRQSNRRPRSEGSHSVKCACDQKDLYDDIDKEYVAFVNQLQLEGEDTAYEIDGGLRTFDQEYHSDDLDEDYVAFVNQLEMDGEDTIYKDDDSPWKLNKVQSESDIEIMDKDPYGGGASTPFVSSNQCEQIDMGEIDVDNYSFAEDPAINCSKFKKGLMEVLKMPYDSKEHEALKHSVSYRSPIIQERDCGSTKKSYRREHKLGKSYLDLHTDFRKQLDEAENDDIKSLNLLRGFVYWLTHISYDMGFKPWLDPSCLEVLPQN